MQPPSESLPTPTRTDPIETARPPAPPPVALTRRRIAPGTILRSLWTQPQVAILLDLLAALGSFYLAFWLRATLPMPTTRGLLPAEVMPQVRGYVAAFMGLQGLLFVTFGLHIHHRHEAIKEAATKIAVATALVVLLMAGALYVLKEHRVPASVVVLFGGLNVVLCVSWRLVRKWTVLHGPIHLVLVALPDAAGRLRQKAVRARWASADHILEMNPQAPNLCDRLVEAVRARPGCEVVVADVSEHDWVGILATIEGRAEQLYLALNPLSALLGVRRIRMLGDSPVLEVRCPLNDPVRRWAKRLLDVAGALLLLALGQPLLWAAALLIRLQDRGRALYFQDRVGLNGRRFRLWKLRTMRPGAEDETGPVLAHEDDPRATPLGRVLRRVRVDEMPQLMNVARGDMSLVGPRPERPERAARFAAAVPSYALRHKVRPGLTGLAQIWGRYDTSAEDKLKLDLYYVYNHSFWLDLQILLQTISVLLSRPGT